MRIRFAVVLGFLGIAAASGAAKKPKPPCIPVFVTSVGARGGFTDPNRDNRDSMKDLISAFAERDDVCVVTAREKARIVLEVQGRERGQTNPGILGKTRDCTVHVKFIRGDFETEISGTSDAGGTWAPHGPMLPVAWRIKSRSG